MRSILSHNALRKSAPERLACEPQSRQPLVGGNPLKFSLFPQWPAQDPIGQLGFLLARWLLLVPKLLAFILLLTQRETRRRFGGSILVLISIVFETILSGLTAPVMMIFQSSAVCEILLGRDAGWNVQRCEDDIEATEIVRKYAMPALVGVGLAVSATLSRYRCLPG